jgi:hypothetical protein
MTSEQRPIGSGFGMESTAGDVLAGVDLTGKLAGVTGGYSGVGMAEVRAFSVNPGGIRTNLQRHVSPADRIQLGWIDENGNDLITWKSAEAGAATAAWAATSGRLDGMGGVYLEDCEVAAIIDPGAPDAMRSGLYPYAADPESAARLWAVSAGLTGVDALA